SPTTPPTIPPTSVPIPGITLPNAAPVPAPDNAPPKPCPKADVLGVNPLIAPPANDPNAPYPIALFLPLTNPRNWLKSPELIPSPTAVDRVREPMLLIAPTAFVNRFVNP